ncbi:MAG: hypothetical protein KDK36_19320, partial [Leptospiraceae bacterium]|nr:hypothetical protein [Leptospiraceae bacterium]
MKLLLNIIIILHLIIFSIYSQDEIEKQKEDLKPDSQSERRMDKKWMLFVSPAPIEFPFGNTRISNRRSLQLQYNWKEYLSFGFNFMHYSEKLNENYFFFFFRNINIIDTKKDQNLLNGFIKFYPFSSLIYINLGGGRNFTGEKQSYSYINLSSTN